MEVRAVSERLSQLGEGPHWDVNSQRLYHVDIFAGDVCRLDPSNGRTETIPLNSSTSFVIPFQSNPDHLIISMNRNEVRKLTFSTGETETLGALDPKNNARFNDGKCDAKGRLWAGTLLEGQPGKGKLYRMDDDYNFVSYFDKVDLSNGLAWSLNNETFYFIDSGPRKVYAFDYDLESGIASNKRTLFDFKDKGFEDCGLPDGMTIDVDGKLWVACYEGGCVLRLDPQTRTIMKKVVMPARLVTSCCFGGPHLDILYVTTGGSISEEEKLQTPLAGAIFAVTGHGTKGLPMSNFKG